MAVRPRRLDALLRVIEPRGMPISARKSLKEKPSGTSESEETADVVCGNAIDNTPVEYWGIDWLSRTVNVPLEDCIQLI